MIDETSIFVKEGDKLSFQIRQIVMYYAGCEVDKYIAEALTKDIIDHLLNKVIRIKDLLAYEGMTDAKEETSQQD